MQETQGSYFHSLLVTAIFGMMLLLSPALFANTTAGSTVLGVSEFLRNLTSEMEQIKEEMERVDDEAVSVWFDSSLKEEAEAALETEPVVTDAAHERWQQVVENERLAAERLSGAQVRLKEIQAYADRVDSMVQRLESARQSLENQDADEHSLSQIETDIASLHSRQQQLQLELDQQRSALQRIQEQSISQTETLEDLMQQTPPEPVAIPVDAENHRLKLAIEALQASAVRRHEARLISARLDQAILQPRIRLLRLEIQAGELELGLIADNLLWLEGEFNNRSTQELRQLNSDLLRLVEREPELAQQYQNEVQNIRSRIDSVAQHYEDLKTLQQQRDMYDQMHNDLSHSLSAVEERLEVSGLTEVVGTQFLDERKRLADYGNPRVTLQVLERQLAQSRLRSISLRDDLRRLQQLPELAAVGNRGLQELVRIGSELLNLQIQSEEQLTEQLRQNEYRLRQNAELIDSLSQILSETLLWWPSHSPVSVSWLQRTGDAFVALVDPSAWRGVTHSIWLATLGSPIISLFVLMLVGGVYLIGRKTDYQLKQIAEQTTHKYSDNIGLTYKAMGWSLVRVLPVPLLLYAFALQLTREELTPGTEILSSVMSTAAGWWLAGHLFVIFTRESGVGPTHFEWNARLLSRVRFNLIWFLPVQLILIIMLALAYGHPDERVYDVFGRLGLLLVTALNGLIAWRILAPAPDDQGVFFQSFKRRILRLFFVFLSVATLVLTLAGYLLTVGELLPRFVDTLVVSSLVLLLYSLAVRAMILSETRLRIRRMKEQRARAALENMSGEVEGVIELPEPHLSIEDIGQQTQTLLKTSVFTGLLIALFIVWADVLPALNWLDNVTLWSRTIAVGETEVISRVSLQDFLLALLLAGFFIMATRNLPGLIEILLSRSRLVDEVHSYTVTTLVRYALAVIAVVTIFSLMGLRWSELQWLVAALTLGLGFGLQEVVANFVSGLIMLFERPVRIGDTITIGEYSGTVARIRTRATTIIDWDNREIVVPNKNFITERLINWTLSDNITRIVIPVGVSYDSDPEQVMEILYSIARAHPLSLKDPEPNVYFLSFADSALSFELRVYVSQMSDRLVTTSELHIQILKAFRKERIEISFPQMDLHIRDMPERMLAKPNGGSD
ncbi:mechanosensitive ion channel domain-containing protein [Nitrincola sp. A-D6]|uniref:mechanosensitive ion channel domain-containing protein n=1 Tax=Nitrincola sp. A-D6 TaxID=1545442 RepID=UPI00068EB44B|nr:mechanosensitive ion channel domain-containing protein [Nitrincola sp. A-D6]